MVRLADEVACFEKELRDLTFRNRDPVMRATATWKLGSSRFRRGLMVGSSLDLKAGTAELRLAQRLFEDANEFIDAEAIAQQIKELEEKKRALSSETHLAA